MSTSRDTLPPDSIAASAATRSLAIATDAAEELALSLATDRTLMLAQIGALIAHEVNNLLCPALARCDLLRAALPPDSEVSPLLDSIQASVAQTATISKTILGLAGDRGSTVRTSVLPCVRRVVDKLLSPSVRSRVVVGDVNPALQVDIPEAELTHIVVNIVLNALHATADSGRGVTIRSFQSSRGERSTRNTGREQIAIVITDDGRGTDCAVLEKYYRTLSWDRGRFVGKNLGTLLCGMLVERAGGEIEVRSEPGRGTTVTVWLPAANQPPSGTGTTSSASTDKETAPPE